jgi:hypothetical protein
MWLCIVQGWKGRESLDLGIVDFVDSFKTTWQRFEVLQLRELLSTDFTSCM